MKKLRSCVVTLSVLLLVVMLVTPVSALAQKDKININTASLEALTQLDRIGPVYAQRIIDYREAHGPFQKPEDIMAVAGIGQKTFEANKDRIVVK